MHSLNQPKVIHICPTYFGTDSVVAGAERYSYELAKAMAKKTPTTLITFGRSNFVKKDEELTLKCFKPLCYFRGNKNNPFSLAHLREFGDTDVIHCHQLLTVITDLSILTSRVMKKKIFVTDLGGNTDFSLGYHLPLIRGVRMLLLISEYNRRLYEHLPVQSKVIYGGVDPLRFACAGCKKRARILHVGRILPHKGIHNLIQALPAGMGLDIVGQVHDNAYFQELETLSRDKDIAFHTNASDGDLSAYYSRAVATVLPATADSGFTTALESLACETPVIATEIGSLPEIVADGVTGFLVPPNNPNALREKIEILNKNSVLAENMGKQGRAEVLKKFTWNSVVDRCLEAYGTNHS